MSYITYNKMRDSWLLSWDKYWEGGDEEEKIIRREYEQKFQNFPLHKLRQHFQQILAVVNGENHDDQRWARFKCCLLKDQELWGVEVFDWTGWKKMGIREEVLQGDPLRYFVVHAAIENCWMGEGRLPSIWDTFDIQFQY